jgi:hypothetical protein
VDEKGSSSLIPMMIILTMVDCVRNSSQPRRKPILSMYNSDNGRLCGKYRYTWTLGFQHIPQPRRRPILSIYNKTWFEALVLEEFSYESKVVISRRTHLKIGLEVDSLYCWLPTTHMTKMPNYICWFDNKN